MATDMKRPGGRTERTRQAVLDATLDVLESVGYGGLTVDAISERSGIHKTTIYRRWGSADKVFFDVVTQRAQSAIPLTATGDPQADLAGMARAIVVNLEDPVGRTIATAALARPQQDPYVSLAQRFWARRTSEAAAIVVAAQVEGNAAADVDPAAVVREIASRLWFQVMVLREPVSEDEIEVIVSRALSPL